MLLSSVSSGECGGRSTPREAGTGGRNRCWAATASAGVQLTRVISKEEESGEGTHEPSVPEIKHLSRQPPAGQGGVARMPLNMSMCVFETVEKLTTSRQPNSFKHSIMI